LVSSGRYFTVAVQKERETGLMDWGGYGSGARLRNTRRAAAITFILSRTIPSALRGTRRDRSIRIEQSGERKRRRFHRGMGGFQIGHQRKREVSYRSRRAGKKWVSRKTEDGKVGRIEY